MTKEELIEKILGVKDVNKDIKVIYEVLDALGIAYKRTGCKKCRQDLHAIALEELGLINSAADNSGWDDDAEYEYLMDMDYSWQGHRLNQDTPKWVVRRFMASHPNASRYYRLAENKEKTTQE